MKTSKPRDIQSWKELCKEKRSIFKGDSIEALFNINEVIQLVTAYEEAMKRVEELESENKKLIEALEWYADPENLS